MQNTSLSPSFLQSDIWGSFRESLGWRAHKVNNILVLERSLPLRKSFLYSPEVIGQPDILLKLLPEIYSIAKRRNSIFYRLEVLVNKTDPIAQEWRAAFTYAQFRKAFESVQPEDRQIITLSSDESVTLAQMRQKGRYNIRLAEKSGVLVREATSSTLQKDVPIFYNLFQTTAKRDKFSIRSESYFSQLCELLYRHNCGRLFIATHQNLPLAAAIVTLYEGTGSYLYGASASTMRHLMAPYALHWTIIQWAIDQGAKHYDMLAIRPEGEKKHPYDGITRFKQQFGGESVHLMGSWDLPLLPAWYNLFKLAEKIRKI